MWDCFWIFIKQQTFGLIFHKGWFAIEIRTKASVIVDSYFMMWRKTDPKWTTSLSDGLRAWIKTYSNELNQILIKEDNKFSADKKQSIFSTVFTLFFNSNK